MKSKVPLYWTDRAFSCWKPEFNLINLISTEVLIPQSLKMVIIRKLSLKIKIKTQLKFQKIQPNFYKIKNTYKKLQKINNNYCNRNLLKIKYRW